MKKKAAALLFVLITTIIIGILAAAILQAVLTYSQIQTLNIKKVKASYLAEAGMQYAIVQLRNKNYTSPVTWGMEEYPIHIVKENQGDGTYKITVTVQYPGV